MRCFRHGGNELRARRVAVRHRRGLDTFYRVVAGGQQPIDDRR
jgi:hypothetical protein